MAANANAEYKLFKYYEGLCSSGDFPKEIAKVLALGVKSKEAKDLDGNVVQKPFTLPKRNWDIVYPAPDDAFKVDNDNMTTAEYEAKILNQVSKVTDTVILKTRTTDKPLASEEIDDLTVDPDSNKSYLEMYLEIYKPTYIANPEEYPLDCERQGIIPKLITKELYEEKFRTHHAYEDPLYMDEVRCIAEPRDDESLGTVNNLTYDEVDKYVISIQNICNDPGFGMPAGEQNSVAKTINAADLAKIKKEDASLYNFILTNLNGGEGIEPKDYTLLESVKFDISLQPVDEDDDAAEPLYQVTIIGITKLTYYNVAKNTTFTLKYMPDTAPIPELYQNGIYIPIDPELYTVTGQVIRFLDNFSFEQSHDGVLVVRYEYTVDGESLITERESLLNNHYMLMRLFDRINEEGDGPAENVYNSAGDVIQTNSHASPWSKLSWYHDFEEIMIDHIDEDVSINAVTDGSVFVPLETPGLNSDTKIRYWVNTNNDRFSLIVMGNPSLDFSRDRHIISACYCGRIDSFENSINDTAGNFALFTSSSTEPCNTTLKTEKVTTPMQSYSLTADEITYGTYVQTELDEFVKSIIPETVTESNGTLEYWIQLPENTYYGRDKWPKYFFADTSTGVIKPVTPLTQAYQREFIMEDGKSSLLKLTVNEDHMFALGQYKLYVAFSYYKEKFVITGGVSRDLFGNVIDVKKENSYGHNTSDGVTSIMMYHTRSKAYYQKHHMLFATTEEYMSKVMYGKSSYTGEYYADRIKVTHGNDGPRGTLTDLLVIDSASLYALDELVINKDFEKDPDELEETFVYFPITAPYSPLSDSPNARYGLAIKKKEIEPKYEDEVKLLQIAIEQIKTLVENGWQPTESNIYPLEVTDNGCKVYWKVVDGTAFTVINGKDVPSEYVPLKLAVINTSAYRGDETNPITPAGETTVEAGGIVANETYSYIKVSGFTANADEQIVYGIADAPITSFGTGAQIKAVMYDGAVDSGSEKFEYNIEGVPFTAVVGDELPTTDMKLIDASPDKYLILYSIKSEGGVVTVSDDGEAVEKHTITKFDCVPLCNPDEPKHALLQYPCTVNAFIEGGRGTLSYTGDTKDPGDIVNTHVDYNTGFELVMIPYADGITDYDVVKVIVETDEDSVEFTEFIAATHSGVSCKTLSIDNVTSNTKIRVQFSTES